MSDNWRHKGIEGGKKLLSLCFLAFCWRFAVTPLHFINRAKKRQENASNASTLILFTYN